MVAVDLFLLLRIHVFFFATSLLLLGLFCSSLPSSFWVQWGRSVILANEKKEENYEGWQRINNRSKYIE